MKRYHIYYLPNAIVHYHNQHGIYKTLTGKVGSSNQPIEKRLRQNKKAGYDITGHEVIAWARTEDEADMFEQQYQVCFDCVEPQGTRRKAISAMTAANTGREVTQEVRDKISLTLTGTKDSDETIEKKRAAALKKPPMTDITKQKLREKHSGKKLTAESISLRTETRMQNNLEKYGVYAYTIPKGIK